MADKQTILAQLGAQLAESRKAREISLQSMSTMTCIRKEVLEGIEAGYFPEGATPMYILSLVRSYINLMQRQDLVPLYEEALLGPKEAPVQKPEAPSAPDASSLHFEDMSPKFEPQPTAPQSAPTSAPSQANFVEPTPSVEPRVEHKEPMAGFFAPEVPLAAAAEAVREEMVGRVDFGATGPVMDGPALSAEQAEAVEMAAASAVASSAPSRRRRGRVQPAQPQPQAQPSRPYRAPRANTPILTRELSRADEPAKRRKSPFGALLMLLATLLVLLLLGWLVYRGARVLFGSSQEQVAAVQPYENEDLNAFVIGGGEGEATTPATDPNEMNTVAVTSEPTAEATTPALTAPAAETPAPAAAGQAGKFVVRVQGGECWVMVKGSGKTLFAKVMKSGDEQVIDFKGALNVEFGAAQHAQISLNGGEFKPAGDGVVRTTYRP